MSFVVVVFFLFGVDADVIAGLKIAGRRLAAGSADVLCRVRDCDGCDFLIVVFDDRTLVVDAAKQPAECVQC
ncbi:MAG TPA: hypothetical protein VGL82_07845 [Bryobacteraceae bacterium]